MKQRCVLNCLDRCLKYIKNISGMRPTLEQQSRRAILNTLIVILFVVLSLNFCLPPVEVILKCQFPVSR